MDEFISFFFGDFAEAKDLFIFINGSSSEESVATTGQKTHLEVATI